VNLTASIDKGRATAKIGDWVCFKSDHEQCGRVVGISRGPLGHVSLILESRNPEGFGGDYIGGQTRTTVFANDCWIEE